MEADSPINVVDSGYRTELHQACSKGVPELVDLLIEYGGDMNAVNEPGNTALHVCASKNQLECAKALLRNGADKNVLNKAGNTAFQVSFLSLFRIPFLDLDLFPSLCFTARGHVQSQFCC